MKARINLCSILAGTAAVLLSTSLAAEDSGFLADYSQLKTVPGTDTRLYQAPEAYTRLKNYTAVMIDQPEFVIAADSKYRGIKPDEAKAVADQLRQMITEAVGQNENMTVVDKPGPGVLYVGIAASNVHLKKKSRGLLGYTPAGFVVGSAVSAAQEMQEKIILQDMNLEMVVVDSQTEEVLMSMVDKIEAGKKAKPGESWANEETVMQYWATRFNCRLENSVKPESEWKDCEATLP